MAKIIQSIFYVLFFIVSSAIPSFGAWQCDKIGDRCISTCIGNLNDCFKSELCNCLNPNQVNPQNQEIIIDNMGTLQLKVTEINPIQSKSRVYFEISANKPSRIEMDDNNKNYLMCKKCTTFKGFKSFKDGHHKIKIRAVDENNNVELHESAFIVDTKRPKLTQTTPKNKQKTSSYIFSVSYSESNVNEVALYFRQENEDTYNFLKRDDCASSTKENKYPICEFDLTNYLHPGKVFFNFEISDQIYETSLKKEKYALVS